MSAALCLGIPWSALAANLTQYRNGGSLLIVPQRVKSWTLTLL